MKSFFPLAISLSAAALSAQTINVIPDGYAKKEGTGYQWAFSKYGPSRCQILFNKSIIKTAPRVVSKMSFRKDGAYVSTTPAPAHSFITTVSIASSGVPDADQSAWLFSLNRGKNFTTVMSKATVNWPKVVMDGKTQPASFVVTWTFTRPVVLTGGNLLIEIDTNTSNGLYTFYHPWYVDAVNLTPAGGTNGTIAFDATRIGCNGTNRSYPSFYASPATYSARPGALMRAYMWRISMKATAAIGFLGTQLTKSVDLSPLGMTGCKLHILPFLMLPMKLGNPNGTSYMRAYGHVPIPNQTSLAGAKFQMQALVVDPGANRANMIMSNMSTTTLGSALPSTGYRRGMMFYSYGSDQNAKVLTWDHARYYTTFVPVIRLN